MLNCGLSGLTVMQDAFLVWDHRGKRTFMTPPLPSGKDAAAGLLPGLFSTKSSSVLPRTVPFQESVIPHPLAPTLS